MVKGKKSNDKFVLKINTTIERDKLRAELKRFEPWGGIVLISLTVCRRWMLDTGRHFRRIQYKKPIWFFPRYLRKISKENVF